MATRSGVLWLWIQQACTTSVHKMSSIYESGRDLLVTCGLGRQRTALHWQEGEQEGGQAGGHQYSEQVCSGQMGNRSRAVAALQRHSELELSNRKKQPDIRSLHCHLRAWWQPDCAKRTSLGLCSRDGSNGVNTGELALSLTWAARVWDSYYPDPGLWVGPCQCLPHLWTAGGQNQSGRISTTQGNSRTSQRT